MAKRISKQTLMELYCEKRLTDREIAELYGVDRTYVVHARKEYGIPAIMETVERSLRKVTEQLEKRDFTVENMNVTDKTTLYDLLVNQTIRLEVMSANVSDGYTFRYSLTSKPENNHVDSKYRITLPNKRSRKLYRNTCDFVVCYGLKDGQDYFWIIPSNDIPDTLQTLSPPYQSKTSKYNKYKDRWDFIEQALLVSQP